MGSTVTPREHTIGLLAEYMKLPEYMFKSFSNQQLKMLYAWATRHEDFSTPTNEGES